LTYSSQFGIMDKVKADWSNKSAFNIFD
jgi:hypothetical protein